MGSVFPLAAQMKHHSCVPLQPQLNPEGLQGVGQRKLPTLSASPHYKLVCFLSQLSSAHGIIMVVQILHILQISGSTKDFHICDMTGIKLCHTLIQQGKLRLLKNK